MYLIQQISLRFCLDMCDISFVSLQNSGCVGIYGYMTLYIWM